MARRQVKKIATAEEVQVIGRPYRLELLESFIDYVQGFEDAWVPTCAQIAERVV